MYNWQMKLFQYENGELEYEDVIELFQYLVDKKLIWSLQGHHQRMAEQLLASGEIVWRFR